MFVMDTCDGVEVPEKIEIEIEVSTLWGYPSSVDPHSVVLFDANDFGLQLESDARTKKPVLAKIPQNVPVYTIGNFLDNECFEKIDRFYPYPDYKDILEDVDKKNNMQPMSLRTIEPNKDTEAHSTAVTPSEIKTQSSTKRPCSPLNTTPVKKIRQEFVPNMSMTPATTYDDLELKDKDGYYICIHCSLTFFTMNEMKAHCADVHKAKPFMCKLCGHFFNSPRSLLVHTFTHTGEKHFSCPHCDATFRQIGHRTSHIKLIHADELPFKCSVCPVAFKHSIELSRHTRSEHAAYIKRCAQCNKTFPSINQLRAHNCTKRERNVKCGACGEKFYRTRDLLTHAKFCKHVDDSETVCDKCGSVFPNAAKCSIHKTYMCTGEPIMEIKSEPFDEAELNETKSSEKHSSSENMTIDPDIVSDVGVLGGEVQFLSETVETSETLETSEISDEIESDDKLNLDQDKILSTEKEKEKD